MTIARMSRPARRSRLPGRCPGGWHRAILCAAWPVVGLLLAVPLASASGLLTPGVGAADLAISGSNVARPLSASQAQFINPAGLAGFTEHAVYGGPGIVFARGELNAEIPEGYDKSNNMVVLLPDLGLVYPTGRWTFGWSVHGSSGSEFEYGAEPELGIEDGFYSSNAILGAPAGAAYRVNDHWWLGAEIIPLYASTKLRYTNPYVPELGAGPVPYRFEVDGLGLQASFGVTWMPDERWSLGFGFRPPGRIWTDGFMRLPSGSKQDVTLEIEAPSETAFGITCRVTKRLTLSYGFRWVDANVFGDAYFRFEKTPSADSPYLPDAQDEWRTSLGAQYTLTEQWELRSGMGFGSAIVGNKGVNPMSYDVQDLTFSGGFGYSSGPWTFDAAVNAMVGAERDVPIEDALVIPGEYTTHPALFFALTITRRL